VPLNAKSMIISGLQPQTWEKYLVQEINAFLRRVLGDRYNQQGNFVEKIASHVQMGLFQVVMCRRDKLDLLSDVELAQVGTGILGVGGNKGAIGCSVKICETKVALINAHLAAS